MRRQKCARITVLLIIIFSAVLLSSLAFAQSEAPALPAFFYGKATVNGKSAPVNSYVIAKIANEKRGQLKITVPGFYGDQNTDQKLAVTGSRSSIGKDIEFFIKIPKLKEIKATQTFKWQSSSINKLDLTFIGEEIIDNSTEILDEQLSDNKESFFYDRITAGKQLMILLSNENIPIIRLQLITKRNLTNVTFDFEVVDNPSAPKLDGVYKYLSISAPKIQQSDIQTAILRFKVSNEWFANNSYDSDKVKLLRYNSNKWNELTTFHEGSDETDNYYRASTPGFSYFAIKSEKLNATVSAQLNVTKSISASTPAKESEQKKEAKTEPEKVIEQQSSVNRMTGFAVEKVKSNPIIGVALVLVGILIGILLTYFFVLRKKPES